MNWLKTMKILCFFTIMGQFAHMCPRARIYIIVIIIIIIR
jgi:hypothetical protein